MYVLCIHQKMNNYVLRVFCKELIATEGIIDFFRQRIYLMDQKSNSIRYRKLDSCLIFLQQTYSLMYGIQLFFKNISSLVKFQHRFEIVGKILKSFELPNDLVWSVITSTNVNIFHDDYVYLFDFLSDENRKNA